MSGRFCDQCDKRIAASARFCPNCGSEQEEVIVREPVSPKLRFEVLKRDRNTCVYCGRMPPEVALEIDHVIPVSRGGVPTSLTWSQPAMNAIGAKAQICSTTMNTEDSGNSSAKYVTDLL